jgi:hypothetical protein
MWRQDQIYPSHKRTGEKLDQEEWGGGADDNWELDQQWFWEVVVGCSTYSAALSTTGHFHRDNTLEP